MKVTFLGTGSSHGVPSLDCMMEDYRRCRKGVCRKARDDPRQRRTRCSLLAQFSGMNVLIDASPDLRQQALREEIKRIDAVLLTHRHADHIMGIPDIRSYTRAPQQPLPVYGSKETLAAVRQSFGYAFDPKTFVGGGIPRLELRAIDGSFDLFGQRVTPIPVAHGDIAGCNGYRLGAVAYIPDIKFIDESQLGLLKGLDCLILNCLRIEREHATHLLLRDSMALARRIGPQRCYFVHMCHDVDYETDSALLDPWMAFAWDGMKMSSGDFAEGKQERRAGA